MILMTKLAELKQQNTCFPGIENIVGFKNISHFPVFLDQSKWQVIEYGTRNSLVSFDCCFHLN